MCIKKYKIILILFLKKIKIEGKCIFFFQIISFNYRENKIMKKIYRTLKYIKLNIQ